MGEQRKSHSRGPSEKEGSQKHPLGRVIFMKGLPRGFEIWAAQQNNLESKEYVKTYRTN